MAARTFTNIPPATQDASGDHFFLVNGPIPVARGNKDLIFTLGDVWSYVTPCRLADYVTPLPDILNCHIEFFLTDLQQNTRVYFDNTSEYLTVINTIDSQVQIFVSAQLQQARELVGGNYFHLLRTTDTQGNVINQTKGRVCINPAPIGVAPAAETDPYALSETPFVPAVVVPSPSSPSQPTGTGTVGKDIRFVFDDPMTLWVVQHNLGGYPSITTVDTTGTRIYGEEAYLDANNLMVTFAGPTTGVVYLN